MHIPPGVGERPSDAFAAGYSRHSLEDSRLRTAVVTPDDDWFMARCVEVPVVSQGSTVDDALANLTEALELYFEDEPAPEPPIVRPIDVRLPA
jgi:predicted RNase H-like HicB family nuclease